MRRYIVLMLLLVGVSVFSFAQKYKVQQGKVTFFSEAPLEDITAKNTASVGLFDSGSGDIAFVIPIIKFEFEKSLMQEHFNEKYMHSDKYPRSTFKGKISGYDLSRKGKQNVKVTGDLRIHGVTKNISVDGTFEVKGKNILMFAKFPVKLEDYNVERPQLLWENIAEVVEVTVDFEFAKK